MIKTDYETIYLERFEKHYDELKWLYCELYENPTSVFTGIRNAAPL